MQEASACSSRPVYLAFRQGYSLLLHIPISIAFAIYFVSLFKDAESEGDPIRVVRVVVVGVAVVVDVPEVAPAIRRTQPPVVRGARQKSSKQITHNSFISVCYIVPFPQSVG